jgi:hypothetical protein
MSKFQQAIKDMKQKRKKVADDIAMLLERESKLRAPVKTGHLRRNTNAETEHQEDKSKIIVGTNGVGYAEVVHEGSTVKNIQGQPYIRDAIEQNMGEIRNKIKEGASV